MCGRFVVARATADLVPLFEVEHVADDLPRTSYNIAPTNPVSVVMESAKQGKEGRRLVSARWGLVPPFKKSLTDRPTPHNATVEKVQSSGMFRNAFKKRRVIIPASGFYERRKSDQQGFYVHPVDESEMLAFAGLCEWWQDQSKSEDDLSRWVLSTTIITQPAQGQMVEVHSREPLYLSSQMYKDWLDPHSPGSEDLINEVRESSSAVASDLSFRPIGPGWLSSHKDSKQDNPSLITEVTPD